MSPSRQSRAPHAGGVVPQEFPPPDLPWPVLWEGLGRVTPGFLLCVDHEGRILFINRVEEGRRVDEVVGRTLGDFADLYDESPIEQQLREAFEHRQERSFETQGRSLAGSRVSYAVRILPIVHAGECRYAIVSCQDSLALRESQERLDREHRLLQQLLEIQERERQLVAYEIHDGFAQYLAGAMLHLQAFEHVVGESGLGEAIRDAEASANLDESLRLLRSAVDESRRLIGGLRPPVLDELGIVPAIESLVADARDEVDEVTFTHDLQGRLPLQLEATIFRIVQESLTNVRRHAQASRCTVAISTPQPDAVRLVIEDNGVGFDPDAVEQSRFGLEGIRQRARLFGGSATIHSSSGAGTVVDATLLVQEVRPSGE